MWTSAVSRYLEVNDLLPYWRQHVGHGIGLRNHEAPFLDVGDHTLVERGMVFTIEPGSTPPDRRLSPFRHRGRDPGWSRRPHLIPQGHRTPDHHGLISRAG